RDWSSDVCSSDLLTIWGAIHARGPFADQGSLNGILSLQLFLVFAAIPFMVLAALVEERKIASKELALSNEQVRESGERLRLAAEAGKMYAYEWDVVNDVIVRSEESVSVWGFSDEAKP